MAQLARPKPRAARVEERVFVEGKQREKIAPLKKNERKKKKNNNSDNKLTNNTHSLQKLKSPSLPKSKRR
jgi:hypothetical protein